MNTKKRKRKGRVGRGTTKGFPEQTLNTKKRKSKGRVGRGTTKLFPGWALAVQVRTDDFVPP